MALSDSRYRPRFSHLLTLTFICSLLIPGICSADDTEAKAKASPQDVYKKLEAAVLAGKITKEEARAKLNALKKQGSADKQAVKESDDPQTTAHLESIWEALQALVDAGKLSEKDAAVAMSQIKRQVFGEKKTTKKKTVAKAPPKDLYKKIEAAVLAGKITKEEAQAKLKALQTQSKDVPPKNPKGPQKKTTSKSEQDTAATKAHFKKIWTELKADVAAGKLTKEEAIAKMAALKKAKRDEP